ncbi:hypothetical protein R3P38DRAFT_1117960 [Favolaschia claudopus]|uniref:Secreted protein n=1 Tax=Favolaschia claudopus TaxID=2862362 RepID=A0AAW0B9Q7_9AGAR
MEPSMVLFIRQSALLLLPRVSTTAQAMSRDTDPSIVSARVSEAQAADITFILHMMTIVISFEEVHHSDHTQCRFNYYTMLLDFCLLLRPSLSYPDFEYSTYKYLF